MEFSEVYPDMMSPVSRACTDGDHRTLRALLRRGYPADTMDNRGWQPLHCAASSLHPECLGMLLLKGGVNVNWQAHDGMTPLLLACSRSDGPGSHMLKYKIVQILLENKADVNIPANCRVTPLHKAIETNHIEVAKRLLKSGAVPDVKDWNGWTPLHFAAMKDDVPMVKLLMRYGANINVGDDSDRSPLFFATDSNAHGAMRVLLQQEGVDVNMSTSVGETPLMIATKKGSMTSIKLLLKHGADPNAECSSYPQSLAIHYAVEYHHVEILDLLLKCTSKAALEKACDISLCSHTPNPLILAISVGNVECVKLLIKAGVQPNHCYEYSLFPPWGNEYYDTALGAVFHMTSPKQEEMLAILLQEGVEVNVPQGNVRAPLTSLASTLHKDLTDSKAERFFTMLLEKGVDVDYQRSDTDFGGPDAILHSSYWRPGFFPVLLRHSTFTASDILRFWCCYFHRHLTPRMHQYGLDIFSRVAASTLILISLSGSTIRRSVLDKIILSYEENYYRNVQVIKMCQKIRQIADQPCSLKNLSRHWIRTAMAKHGSLSIGAVETLGLPQALRDYILYQNDRVLEENVALIPSECL